MKDVILINPLDTTDIKEKLRYKVPPLNLMYLASSLESASLSVGIIDDNLKEWGIKKVTKIIKKLNPSIVGVTATTPLIKKALEYIKSIKKLLPNILTVIGGPHATFLPIKTLRECPELDVVVIGEGEETFKELALEYESKGKKCLEKIRGIAYRDNDERLHINDPRPLIENLDEIPFPARHLVPFKEYNLSEETGGIISSRGCPYNCEYCSSSKMMGKRFRYRSAENIVDEIEELVNDYNVREITFLDDTFTIHRRRIEEFCNELKNRDLDIDFTISSRVDTINRDTLKNLKTVGLNRIYYGAESGSQRVLNLMKKGITLKQIKDAVKVAKNLNLQTVTSFMFGYPGETLDEMNKTIDFSIKLDPDYCQYSILTPFPGTPIYYKLKRKGLINENWEEYTVLNPVIKYEKLGLSKKLVKKILEKAYVKFYARPSYLIKHPWMFKVFIETTFRTYIEPKYKNF